MTYSSDPRARLADRLRDLFPAARSFTFDTVRGGGLGDGSQTVSLRVELDDGAFDDLPNGLSIPGPALAETLTSLGWTPGTLDGDPVDDDVPAVTFNAARPDSPVRLLELRHLIECAYARTPGHDRDGVTRLR